MPNFSEVEAFCKKISLPREGGSIEMLETLFELLEALFESLETSIVSLDLILDAGNFALSNFNFYGLIFGLFLFEASIFIRSRLILDF